MIRKAPLKLLVGVGGILLSITACQTAPSPAPVNTNDLRQSLLQSDSIRLTGRLIGPDGKEVEADVTIRDAETIRRVAGMIPEGGSFASLGGVISGAESVAVHPAGGGPAFIVFSNSLIIGHDNKAYASQLRDRRLHQTLIELATAK